MNICIAVKTLTHPNGGVCTHILDLCRYYASQGHKIVLLADGSDYQEEIEQIPELIYIRMPFCAMNYSPVRIFSVYQRMRSVCKQYYIDIIHLHGQCIIPVAWLCKITTGIPFLWTNHIDAIPQPKILAIMGRVMKFPVISVSQELQNDLVDRLKFQNKGLYVVFNGISFADYSPLTEEEKQKLRKLFHIEDGEIIVTELARLNSGKAQHFLIRAMCRLQEKYPEKRFHVIFAGTGDQNWFEREVMQFAAENRIKTSYLGYQKARDVFGVAHFSVLPSYFEGFPCGVIESLAMECPVIRSDTPGWSAMKDYCSIFHKGNMEELVTCLENMVNTYPNWKSIVAEGQKDIRDRFSKEHMGSATMGIYMNILKKSRRWQNVSGV